MLGSNIQIYIDFKSPYAYLAVASARELEQRTGIQLDWLPSLSPFRPISAMPRVTLRVE